MNKRNVVAVLFITALGSFFAMKSHRPLQKTAAADIEIKDKAVSHKTFRNPPAVASSEKKIAPSNSITTHKMNARLETLLKSKAFVEANPGIDFSKLKLDDANLASLKLPVGMSLIVMRNDKCGPNSTGLVGKTTDSAMGSEFEKLDEPKFASVKTEEPSTIGELEAKIASDDCTLGVFPNGSIDDFRIPKKADLERSLREHPVENIAIYDYETVMHEGYEIIKSGLAEGSPKTARLFVAGASAEQLGIADQADATAPLKWLTTGGGAGEVYLLPLPSGGSPSEQIANANNAVIAAIARGANFVMLPAADPSVFSAVAQYAAQNGVKVYMLPRDVPFRPSDASRIPAASESQATSSPSHDE